MAKRKGGNRRKTRKLMTKNVRKKGKINITACMENFNPGEKIILRAEPAIHKGLFNLRFQGKTANVLGKRGRCYELELFDGGKRKTLFVPAIHLMRMKK